MKHFLLGLLLSIPAFSFGQLKPFGLGEVQLGECAFHDAQNTSYKYVMAHDVDRLLVPFRREAGLPAKAVTYGNWENTGLDGHVGGHYLTALAQIVGQSGDSAARSRLNYMVDELALCQKQNGNGYVGGIPGSKQLWDDVANGKLTVDNFSVNRKWVPWYNIHKLFAGLRDAYVIAGNEKAKEVLIGLCDWCDNVTAKLTDEQMQNMLRAEHGGMNEVFADVYHITGNEKYLTLAKRFSHQTILQPLLNHQDKLNGMHANTQIPKIIGFERVGEEMHDSAWVSAAAYFWETVVSNRSVAIGGNSVSEHFHPANNFTSMMESREGPETCNTYNMMKLAKLLYLHTGDIKYIEYYERAMFNHILSSQHPEHGGLVYFTSMRPRHYRVYSKAETAFWCCVGSGMENHSKYGELIYAHSGNDLYVNLYVPSQLTWSDKKMAFALEGDLLSADKFTFKVTNGKSQKFTVNFRAPKWVTVGSLSLVVNGKTVDGQVGKSGYVAISRKWRKGDKVEVLLPMHPKAEFLPDGSSWFAVTYGPFVLAAKSGAYDMVGLVADDSRMGHVANGALLPFNEAPVWVGNLDSLRFMLDKTPNQMSFQLTKGFYPASNISLMPFYQIHDQRYQVYWQASSLADVAKQQQEAKAREDARLALDAKTIDYVSPGEQQPESDHNFRFDRAEAGVHRDRHWRHAQGWFSYDLKKPETDCATLRITYFGLDANRTFNILVNEQLVANVKLDGKGGDGFVDIDYPLDANVLTKSIGGKVVVKFEAVGGSFAGGIYGVRLLKCD